MALSGEAGKVTVSPIIEARELASETARTTGLPRVEKNGLAGGFISFDDLILRLDQKEANAPIGFDATPLAPTAVGEH